MVELALQLDTIFSALADTTRRDILKQVSVKDALTISELAQPYDMSFAGVAKHVVVLENAGLITKHRDGKEQLVKINPEPFKLAESYFSEYEALWQERFDRLEELLS